MKTPLGLALRGRFLVGSRPVDADFARRFVASAAENGIDVFRLHDPLNDVSNLREAAEAIVAADREFDAGLVYSPGPTSEVETLIERAKALPELGAVRVLLHDPTGSLQPHRAGRLVGALARGERPAGRHLLPGLGRQRARRHARGRARGRPADRLHDLPARPDAAPRLGRGALRGARRPGPRPGHRRRNALGRLGPRRRAHRRRARRSARAAHRRPRGPARSARGPRRRRRLDLRAQAAGDRLDEVIEELDRIRAEVGWPPLAAPIGQMLARRRS